MKIGTNSCDLGGGLVSAFNPSGVREEELVRTIIETRWQLRRANLVDSELFQIYGFYKGQNRGVGTAFAQDATQGNAFSKLTRYQGFLLRKLHVAEQELSRLKAEAAKAPRVALPALVLSGESAALCPARGNTEQTAISSVEFAATGIAAYARNFM